MGSAPPYRNRPLDGSSTASDRQFQALFESALDAILVLDDRRVYLDANPSACSLFGLSYENLIGRRLDEFLDPEIRAELDERWALFMDRGSGAGELQIHRPDETSRDVELTSRASFLPGRHLAILRDITEQKIAEEALQASEERFYVAFNANPHPTSIFTHEERGYLEVNDSFLRTTGYERKDVIGATAVSLGLWVSEEARDAALRRLDAEGAVLGYESELRTRAGDIRLMLVSLERIEIDGVACVLETSTDITERKRLEAQLQQSQRLEGIGRLAGGIAHDFNNLLTVISGYADLALKRIAENDPLRKDLQEIRKASERATTLTRQLLAYSRKQLLKPLLMDLNGTVAEMSSMLDRLIGDNVLLEVRLDPDLGRVKADPGQIEQVIANLAINARDAMTDGGKITILTRNVDLGDDDPRLRLGAPVGPYVLLAVTDTGHGMDEQMVSRIFEPFFTTKEMGKGTGLGLSTVYGIVTQSGGWIDVTSSVGAGTTFSVLLPRVPVGSSVAPRVATEATPVNGNETVLVVEDRPEVRRLVVETLVRHGYEVHEAADGDAALHFLATSPARIDLLVTDVVMPGMGGRALAQLTSLDHPRSRVLYISGHLESEVVHEGVVDESIAFLAKPFTPDELARKVREVLDA